MLKNIIIQQKNEKAKLIAKSFIHREKIAEAKRNLSSDLIKVILGPRRAGKSVFSYLLLKDKDFAYLNFDDDNLRNINNSDEIIKYIFEVYKKPKFLLFDEIQNLKNWELFVNKLHRRGFNLILTGSNANLLSKELSTSLTGRHFAYELFPFTFTEFLNSRNVSISKDTFHDPETKGEILNHLNDYLLHGGFPEIVVKNYEPKQYLTALLDSILLKDIVKRYNVRFSQKIEDLFTYLVSNFSLEFSFTKLKNILGFNSTHTLQNYLKYLTDAYLIFSLNRYSHKVKEQINAPKKLYLVDNGFIEAKSFQVSKNMGRLIENCVFVELLNRKYRINLDLFYYKTRNQKEIDFILRKGIKVNELIQICYDLSDPSTEKREINALLEGSEELKCNDLKIITWDKEKEVKISKKKILFIPLFKWLLTKESV